MHLITLAQEIDLEQEVIVATLDGLLQQRSRAKELARKANLTPVYISYIRNGIRMPYAQTAKAIACALSLPPAEQQVWLNHVDHYWRLKRQLSRQARQFVQAAPAQAIDEIRQAYRLARTVRDPRFARQQYTFIRQVANTLLEQIQPDKDPFAYLELGVMLQATYSIFNQRIDALYVAKRARLIAESLDRSDFPRDAELLDTLKVDTLRSEAVCLYNLKLYRQSYALEQRAQAAGAVKSDPLAWTPRINRSLVEGLAHLPRFAISEAKELATQALALCEKRGDQQDEVWIFLINQALAAAYIQHRNFKHARGILEVNYRQVDKIPNFSALCLVLFLRTFARLCWREAKFDQWRHLTREAITIARQADFRHELVEIQQEYPNQFLQEIYPDCDGTIS
jgi:transcriptional regulator with XRE-family HTH domain